VKTSPQLYFTLRDALISAQRLVTLTPQSCYNLEGNQGFHKHYDYEYSYIEEN